MTIELFFEIGAVISILAGYYTLSFINIRIAGGIAMIITPLCYLFFKRFEIMQEQLIRLINILNM